MPYEFNIDIFVSIVFFKKLLTWKNIVLILFSVFELITKYVYEIFVEILILSYILLTLNHRNR